MRFVRTAENNKNFVVYCHINKKNGKMYIGITCQKPSFRWNKGKAYKNNKPFSNAIAKYGWDGFYHLIIAKNLEMKRACELEKTLVCRYNTYKRENGYNLTCGGEVNIVTEDAKKLISEKMKKRMSNPNERKKISDSLKRYYKENPDAINQISKRSKDYYNKNKEHLKKISVLGVAKTKGIKKDKKTIEKMLHWQKDVKKKEIAIKKGAEKRKIPVICVDTGVQYNSAADASMKTGIIRSSIISCCRGKIKTAGGKRWIYKDRSRVNYKIETKSFGKKTKWVVCIETGQTFPSIKDAAVFLGKKPSNISKCLKNKQVSCCGFHWDYYKSKEEL